MASTESPLRRQPSTARSERRVEGLLSVAKAVFAEKGFAGATTQEIAQRAGVSEATVFTYFGSKRDLCMEVVRRWYDQISTVIEQEIPHISGLRNQLQFLVRQHLENLMGEGAGICALVLSEGRTADEAFGSVIADLKRRYTAPLMSILKSARAAQEIRPDIPLALFRDLVYGSMEHVLWDYVESGKKPDIGKTSRDLTEFFCGAFLASNAPGKALQEFRSEIATALQKLDRSL